MTWQCRGSFTRGEHISFKWRREKLKTILSSSQTRPFPLLLLLPHPHPHPHPLPLQAQACLQWCQGETETLASSLCHRPLLNSSDEKLGTNETIKNLHHEIQSLCHNRSNLHRYIEELKSNLERSDASAMALATHASELVRIEEDLSSAIAITEDASNIVKSR